MAAPKIFFIVGPSGVGKGTLVGELKKRHTDWYFPPSVTTRQPRSGEVDGAQYKFVSDIEFDNYITEGELLEWALVHGLHRYGTLKKLILAAAERGQTVVREVDIQGLISIKKNLDQNLFKAIFIAPPDLATLRERILRRQPEMDPQELADRLTSVAKELAQQNLADAVVISQEGAVEQMVEEVEGIIRKISNDKLPMNK